MKGGGYIIDKEEKLEDGEIWDGEEIGRWGVRQRWGGVKASRYTMKPEKPMYGK